MTYYFEDIKKTKELKIILDSWLYTPFKHKVGVKGMGCDCIHFAVRVFEEINLLNFKYIQIPNYPRDWHIHNTKELLKEAILKYLKVDEFNINAVKLINGDIILSHYGKAASHAGIFYDGYVYQSLDGVGVRKININDQKMKKQMRFVFRILS